MRTDLAFADNAEWIGAVGVGLLLARGVFPQSLWLDEEPIPELRKRSMPSKLGAPATPHN